jgi:hypothetical protein
MFNQQVTYTIEVSDIHLGEQSASLVRMSDVFKGVSGILAGFVKQDLISTRMLVFIINVW